MRFALNMSILAVLLFEAIPQGKGHLDRASAV